MIKICNKCDISLKRKNIVNGSGNPNANIMFIGESPGYYEDRSGLPFVGKSGEMLDKYLYLFNLNRDDIYITNIIKCRPPRNRVPTFREISNCMGYLRKEIISINPKIIVLLGTTALRVYFNNFNLYMYQYAGKIYKVGNRYVIPMYHPSHLLRNTNAKIPTFRYFEKLMKVYKREVDMFHQVNY